MSLKIAFGQHLYVFGSLPSLGSWQQPVHRLQWQPEDVWVSGEPVEVEIGAGEEAIG